MVAWAIVGALGVLTLLYVTWTICQMHDRQRAHDQYMEALQRDHEERMARRRAQHAEEMRRRREQRGA